jgi:hypothetical protein
LRRGKYAGFLVLSLGALLIIGAAVMPVGQATERLGPFRLDFASDNCGPAVYVAFHRPDTDCGTAAAKRLEASTPIGLLVLALGMAMFAGGDEGRGSRVQVAGSRGRRRPGGRTPGRGRYMPS